MTREEAERVAAMLVTVEDDSFTCEGIHYTGWIVRVGQRVVEEESYKDGSGCHVNPEHRAGEWRDAIVRALVGG